MKPSASRTSKTPKGSVKKPTSPVARVTQSPPPLADPVVRAVMEAVAALASNPIVYNVVLPIARTALEIVGKKVLPGQIEAAWAALVSEGLIRHGKNNCWVFVVHLRATAVSNAARLGVLAAVGDAISRCVNFTVGLFDVYSWQSDIDRIRRAGLFYLFSGDIDKLDMADALWTRNTRHLVPIRRLAHVLLADPVDEKVIRSLPPPSEDWFAESWISDISAGILLPEPITKYFERRAQEPDAPLMVQAVHIFSLVWSGRMDEALDKSAQWPGTVSTEIPCWVASARGEPDAVAKAQGALRDLRKLTGKKNVNRTVGGICFEAIALIRSRESTDLVAAEKLLADVTKKHSPPPISIRSLQEIVAYRLGKLSTLRPVESVLATSGLSCLLALVSAYSVRSEISPQVLSAVNRALESIDQRRHRWVYAQLLCLKLQIDPTASSLSAQVETLGAEMGIVKWVCDLLPRQSAWEQKLDALETFLQTSAELDDPARVARLVWVVTPYASGFSLEAKEQKRTVSGTKWTKGAPVAISRLAGATSKAPDSLTPQDREVCALIRHVYNPWGAEWTLDGEQALAALVGHPAVFLRSTEGEPIEVARGEVVLSVKKATGGYQIQMVPNLPTGTDVHLVLEDRRIVVYRTDAKKQRAAALLGDGLILPKVAESRLKTLLPRLAKLATVHSVVAGEGADAPAIVGDPRPRALLTPRGTGVVLDVRVRPMGDETPTFIPGHGGQTVLLEISGQRKMVNRKLKQEITLASAMVQACPTLGEDPPDDHGWSWDFPNPITALELLSELSKVKDSVILEWAEGKKLAAPMEVTARSLRVQVTKQSNYFAASTDIVLDDGTILEFSQLIDAYRKRGQGRFVVINDDKVLALSEELRRALEDMEAFGEISGSKWKFSPVQALAVQPIFDIAGELKTDKHWKSWIDLLAESEKLEPEVPAAFREVLRSYQVDGFQWLVRLAHAQLGACLADDMGLGKTIQALAVLTYRAKLGPALVAAPTSVCMNWMDETRKFAPDIRAMLFGGGDRAKIVEEAGPGDLVVVSYGLLLSEAELFASREFATIILDEAQWIKNVTAKRSQAAMALKGEFRMITTGTPVENHLGELWNLFRFINPGLLGSLERFNSRFAVPIERNQDRTAKRKLKTLIGPFVLRRTKGQVLEELPSRTEITVQVVPSAEEVAFYEALRRKAMETISASGDAPVGQKHFQVLAELMRLRRACCHPKLVVPEAPVGSSKLQTFMDIVTELLDNAHRALVFSQFVDHLTLTREALDAKGIKYQYLDGSTPAPERRKRVEAFQRGEGDLFLISLKAGGVGLNLTGADYVIHLDPWWNPAVEDQASDRAHRLGQTRPVTIYRLVMQHTVESRIVDLHRHKRDLATSLLEGTETAGKISYNDLVALLKE